MTPHEIQEMEWLAAGLAATASRMKRAAALLRAAGDLAGVEKRLAAALGRSAAPIAGDEASRRSPGMKRPGEAPASARLGSSSTADRAAGACAVFAVTESERRNNANQGVVDRQKANRAKTTAQDCAQRVRREVRDIDVVPF